MQGAVWKTSWDGSWIQIGTGKEVFECAISAKTHAGYTAMFNSSNYIFAWITICS